MGRKMSVWERRAKRKGVILEQRMGPTGELFPVVMAKIVNMREHIVEVISPYNGGKNLHGSNPDTETADPLHRFLRSSMGGFYFFQLPAK